MFRNWMNSLGVKPRVNYIYSDLASGNIIFQVLTLLEPLVTLTVSADRLHQERCSRLEEGGVRGSGMVGLAFFVTGLGWSGLASFLSNRAGLERAGLGWQVLTKTGLQGFSLA